RGNAPPSRPSSCFWTRRNPEYGSKRIIAAHRGTRSSPRARDRARPGGSLSEGRNRAARTSAELRLVRRGPVLCIERLPDSEPAIYRTGSRTENLDSQFLCAALAADSSE